MAVMKMRWSFQELVKLWPICSVVRASAREPKVAGLIPDQGYIHTLVAGLTPSHNWGACRKQAIDVSFLSQCFPLSLPFLPPFHPL